MVRQLSKNMFFVFHVLISILLFTSFANASGSGITYSGRLLDPNGNAVVSNNVQFKLQIRTPGNENCLMYEEIQSKDMTNSDGVFSITINDGTGSRTDATGFALDQLFANRGSFNFPGGYCVTGVNYSPNSTDGRKLQVYFNDGSFATGQWEPTPAMAINFIPMAIEAQQVGGYKKEQILKLADGVTTTGSELDATKWTSLQALINGTSTVYSKPTDQVTQLYGAAIPAPANGQSIRWNTTLNAGSGGWENFTAGSASAVTSVSSANTDIAVANGSTTPQLTLNSGTGANQIVKLNGTAQLPAVDGANLTNVSASKIVGTAISIASLANGQVLKYNGTNWVNAADADALGGLSCANGRVAYYTGGSWACLEVTSGNTINSIVSRDGSGISNFGTVNTGTLKLNDGVSGEISLTTPITVTSYAMRLPSSVGTAGQVLTTDGNSPAQLSWASTSSQWTTSASDIYYNTGKVGIGTSTPATPLSVVGGTAVTSGITVQDNSTNATLKTGRLKTAHYTNAQAPVSMLISQTDSAVSSLYIGGSSATENAMTDIHFYTAANNTTIQGTERMVITSAGNVGIGTTSPSYPLHVVSTGSPYTPARFESTCSGCETKVVLRNTSNGASSLKFSANTNGEVSGISGFATSAVDGAMAFYTVNGGTNGERMRITNTGAVGIGTASPTANLEVIQTSSATTLPNVLTVTGGQATGGSTNGGGISLTGGIGVQYGGAVTIASGDSNNGGLQGRGSKITLAGGFGGGGGGDATIEAGNANNGWSGGNINLNAGNYPAAGSGGTIQIVGGAYSPGNGGNILINGGAKAGAGVNGNVILANLRGNVGIGSSSPTAKLQVSGQIASTTYNNGAATDFDMSLGNTQYTSASCGAMTMSNIVDGASYTIVVQGATSGTCTFTAAGYTYRFSPANGATTASTHSVYSMQVVGTIIYVSWITGF